MVMVRISFHISSLSILCTSRTTFSDHPQQHPTHTLTNACHELYQVFPPIQNKQTKTGEKPKNKKKTIPCAFLL
uniref:Putative secreted protein n=1 Tax=Anopheles marajoara TaxID=58244 RepID=A0A2M4CDD0_9DIPT